MSDYNWRLRIENWRLEQTIQIILIFIPFALIGRIQIFNSQFSMHSVIQALKLVENGCCMFSTVIGGDSRRLLFRRLYELQSNDRLSLQTPIYLPIYPVRVNYCESTPLVPERLIPGVAPGHLRSPWKSLCSSLRLLRQKISLICPARELVLCPNPLPVCGKQNISASI